MKIGIVYSFLFILFISTSKLLFSQNNTPQTIDGNNFLKDWYSQKIQKQNINTSDCFYIVLNENDFDTVNQSLLNNINARDSLKDSSNTLLKTKKKPLIIQSQDLAWGDSSKSAVRLKTRILCDQHFLGFIKIKYHRNKSSLIIIKNTCTAEIKNKDLMLYLKDKKEGTYKLACYFVNISLEFCHNKMLILSTSFFSFE